MYGGITPVLFSMSDSSFRAPSIETMDELLPNLEFIGVLSSNATGAVYYANQKSLDRDVAVKLFCPVLSAQEVFRSHFVGSCSSMAGLRHPNLIGVFDSGTVQGMSYAVIEFVPGKSLSRSTRGHAIEFKQALELIRQICDGIAYAHQRRIVHGYLSPHDILLNEKASPKIGNFGLGLDVHTLPEGVVSTHFAAPEVREGEEPTEAADLYSLAAIFYELITGNPYQPGGPHASELEGTPAAIDQIIDQAGSRDPARRDMNPREFFERLQQAVARSARRPQAAAVAPVAGAAPRQLAPLASTAVQTGEKKVLGKVVVILLLLIAIQQVWTHRGIVLNRERPGDKDAGVEDVEAVDVGATPVIRRPDSTSRSTPRTPPVVESPPDAGGFPVVEELPMDSLERLRDSLAQGNRQEMPRGTLTEGDRRYFLVTRPMSWPEAVSFAEQHGGWLALPDAVGEWSAKEPIAGENIWIGVARSGASSFTRLDGKVWNPGSSVEGQGPYVHMAPGGSWQTASGSSTKPFVIEWNADGTQAANLEAQLSATAASLRSSSPVYPPGTVAVDKGRHLLPISRPLSWDEARKLAESSGGMLAVLSDADELAAIQRVASAFPSGREFWMGARLEGDSWQWVTGEPWRAVVWLNQTAAAEDRAAMLLKPGVGVDARNRDGSAAGLLIEWSRDAETNKAPAQAGPSAGNILADLKAKAGPVVIKAGQDREAAHTKNTEKLAWDLDAHMRGLNKSTQQQLAPEVEKLKGCVRDNRLLKETIEAEGVVLSPFMAKLCNYLIAKQAEIDEQYQAQLQVIHTSYRARLIELRDQAKEAGQIRVQLQTEQRLEESENLDSWVAAMSME